MTDAELKGIAAQALNMAKLDLERGTFSFLFALYFEEEDPPLRRLRNIEQLISERLGKDWLNFDDKKALAFRILREGASVAPPDAIVIATAINSFRSTERFNALPEAQQRKIEKRGMRAIRKAVTAGLFTRADGIQVVVQTPERVCHCVQDFDSNHQPVGGPRIQLVPQSNFGGRLKMFGQEGHGQ